MPLALALVALVVTLVGRRREILGLLGLAAVSLGLAAFWLLPADKSWPPEIDIMEILWKRPNSYHHSLHRYNYNCQGNHASDEAGHEMPALWEDFHVFRADWDTWFVNFYVDDVLIYRSCRVYDLLTRPVSDCHIPTGIYMQNQAFPGQDADMSIILGMHRASHGIGPHRPL